MSKIIWILLLFAISLMANNSQIAILNDNINSIIEMNKQGKSLEYIQSFLDSNFSIIYQSLNEVIKEDKDLVKKISSNFAKANLIEKKQILRKMNSIKNKTTFTLEDKQIILEMCLQDKTLIQNKKLQLILKGLPMTNLMVFANDLNLKKTKQEQEAYLNKVSEQKRRIKEREEASKEKTKEKIKENKVENKKESHLYNQEYYDFIKDEKLSRDKIDIIKYAYFQNGVNLEDFKKDLGEDLYKCDRDQLENYVNVYTRFQDGYLSKEEYFFSKRIIEDDHITQEEIKKDVLPVIEKYDLTEKQIIECVDIGATRSKGDCRKFLDLAVEAKERNYSNFEINELIDDSRDKPTSNVELKREMIHIYGKCNITEVDKLNDYTEKQMEVILAERDLALELNGLPEFEPKNLEL